MDAGHDLLPEAYGGVLGGVGEDNLLRIVVAAPDHRRIVRRVAGEPAVIVAGGGAGLAGHGHVLQLGTGAGAGFDGILHHIGGIPGRLLAHGHPGVLGVVQDHLAVGIEHTGIGSSLAVKAVVGEGGIGLGHIPDGDALGEAAHGHGRQVNIREHCAIGAHILRDQAGEPHLVPGKVEGRLRAHLRHQLHRHGVEGKAHGIVDGDQAAIGGVGILRPGRRIGELIGRIVIDRGGRDEPQLHGGRKDRDGLDGGAGGEIALGGAV